MRPLRGRVTRLAMPIRVMAHRFAFVLLVFAAVAMLIAGKADLALIERFRTQVVDIAAPVLDAASHPIAAFHRGLDKIGELAFLYSENQRLTLENERLRHWQDVARQLARDNAQYRHLLNVKSGPDVSYVSARVIGDSGGPFVRTLLLGAGEADGVTKGQAVISANGLVGRIAELGQRTSRVLLLTDLNSRIPVLLEGASYRAILAGDNTDQPRLEFLPVGAEVKPGDRIVTSGHGGLFPPGRPVGVISSLADGIARVQPFTDWQRLEQVSVLRFDMPRLEASAQDQ